MKTELFIASKLSSGQKGKLSSPIIRISMISIILGIAVMLVSMSILNGFQAEIRDKVTGFSGDIRVSPGKTNASFESAPFKRTDSVETLIYQYPNIKSTGAFITKPAIVQTKKDSLAYTTTAGIDTFRVQREIAGVIIKGVDKNYDWGFLEHKLIEGVTPENDTNKNPILISKSLAKKLNYQVGEKVKAFFLKQSGPRLKSFTICGIYQTGLEEFDAQLAYTDLSILQEVNEWGIQAKLTLKDSCSGQYYIVDASYNSDIISQPRLQWSNSKVKDLYRQYITFQDYKDITLKVWEGDDYMYLFQKGDMSKARIKVTENKPCPCNTVKWDEAKYEAIGDSGRRVILNDGDLIVEEYWDNHAFEGFIGAYELRVEDWNKLDTTQSLLYLDLPIGIKAETVEALYPEIFSWINYLNINLYIIITMMILVAIINITSTLLVIILEKKNVIGILKTLGAQNKIIGRVFLMKTSQIILKAMLWGNLIAILLLFAQTQFNLVSLDPEVYFVSTVPVKVNILYWVVINVLTFGICLIAMMLPAAVISRIHPAEVLRFR